jgi:SAM-dependent methyltransferase
MSADTTGKVSLDHIYTQPDPRAYFGALRGLEYRIPQTAKPFFADLIAEYRRAYGVAVPSVLDLGCSYGINGALLRCDATMDELYDRYSGPGAERSSHAELLESDRSLVHSRGGSAGLRFVGLDASRPALSYAVSAGFVDDALHADFENEEPGERERELLAGIDLVISTGCIGYITEKTISRIVEAQDGRRPWMAHFVLRMYPFEPVEAVLDAAGYRTVRHEGVFRQRRFAGEKERADVLGTLSSAGLDPGGLESDGWFYAHLYISRPQSHSERGAT